MIKKLLMLGFKPLTWLNKRTKKSERMIFFYSNLGFRDNVFALYEYLIENKYNKKYKIVVSVSDYKNYLEKAPKNVTFVSTKKGIKYFLKSKYCFYCFGKYPIKPSKDQVVINLWHGTPLKKIGNLERGLEKIDYNFFTYVLTNSEMYVPIMAKIFGCKEEAVKIVGNPRNDEMFKEDALIDVSMKGIFNKVITWLPTYREYDDKFFVNIISEDEFKDLNEYLKKKRVKLVIKPHPLQVVAKDAPFYSNIRVITDKQLRVNNISVYTVLRNTDGLITDYSSVYFDYMLLDRPIAFAVDDIDNYGSKRGFVFDNPEEYMPGMSIKCLDDVKKFIDSVINEEDEFKQQRRAVSDKVNYYKDGDTSKRIVERFIEASEIN